MQVVFVGEPRDRFEAGGLEIAARADGTGFFCVVTAEAIQEVAKRRERWDGGSQTWRVDVFRQHRDYFLAALAKKLGGLDAVPREVSLTAADVDTGSARPQRYRRGRPQAPSAEATKPSGDAVG